MSAATLKRPFAYASLIKAVTVGLYPNRKHILREFVQNAYDGLTALRRADPSKPLWPVEIAVVGPSLTIADRGIGMSGEKMQEYRYLGYSEKQPGMDAGFRGIGKFSPVTACERIVVRSSKLGEPKKYEVVIEAAEMLAHEKREKNAPLEEVLEKYTSVEAADENPDEHYTFVELYGIKPDSQELLAEPSIREYLTRVAPLPFDPHFKYGPDVTSRLQALVPNYMPIEVKLNGAPVFKPLIDNYSMPEFETVYADDQSQKLIAVAWYCGHTGRGQFQEQDVEDGGRHRHPHSGLVFRVSNFTVGDPLLTRRALWSSTPERAYNFFGEIHVLDHEVLPTSDRDNFEQSEARSRLYQRCRKISQDLNLRAASESNERRFGEVVALGQSLVAETEKVLKAGSLEQELREDKDYAIQRLTDDLRKRLKRTKPKSLKDKRIIRRAQQVVKRGEAVRKSLKGDGKNRTVFVDIKKDLQLEGPAADLYDTIIGVLRQEFGHDKDRFAALLKKIHAALRGQA